MEDGKAALEKTTIEEVCLKLNSKQLHNRGLATLIIKN